MHLERSRPNLARPAVPARALRRQNMTDDSILRRRVTFDTPWEPAYTAGESGACGMNFCQRRPNFAPGSIQDQRIIVLPHRTRLMGSRLLERACFFFC